MQTIPEQIVYFGSLMFSRSLTDIAGGNISVRAGDQIFITPRYAGQKWHWNLSPGDILSGRVDQDELLSNPAFSREGLSHLAVYRAFPEVEAIIHAHPIHVLPFCAIEKPIEPILTAMEDYGTLEYIPDAPSYSQQQADYIVEALQDKKTQLATTAAAVLMPRHGIFIAGRDLWTTMDALDRINTNAWCLIAGLLITP